MKYDLMVDIVFRMLVILFLILISVLLWSIDISVRQVADLNTDINHTLNNLQLEIEYENQD